MKRQAGGYEQQNRRAAEIIVADSKRYGGPESLVVLKRAFLVLDRGASVFNHGTNGVCHLVWVSLPLPDAVVRTINLPALRGFARLEAHHQHPVGAAERLSAGSRRLSRILKTHYRDSSTGRVSGKGASKPRLEVPDLFSRVTNTRVVGVAHEPASVSRVVCVPPMVNHDDSFLIRAAKEQHRDTKKQSRVRAEVLRASPTRNRCSQHKHKTLLNRVHPVWQRGLCAAFPEAPEYPPNLPTCRLHGCRSSEPSGHR